MCEYLNMIAGSFRSNGGGQYPGARVTGFELCDLGSGN